MIVADLSQIAGRTYPARRRTQNLVGGASPIQATNFSMGHVTLEPKGGQVPWHNQEQEEIYFVLEGIGEMCLGEERQTITAGQAVYIPSGVFHQLTNIASAPPNVMLAACGRMHEAGVKLIGLASLDETATAVYDHRMAERLVDTGMEIAALTPKHFAEWLARVMQTR